MVLLNSDKFAYLKPLKKILSLALLLIFFCSSNCLAFEFIKDSLKKPREELFQRIYFGIKAGGNINKLKSFEPVSEGGHSSISYTDNYKNPYYVGWNGGISADFIVNKFLSVQAELLYYHTFQRVKYTGGNNFMAFLKIETDYSSSQVFYNIPLLIKLSVGNKIICYANFGISFGSSVYHKNKGSYLTKTGYYNPSDSTYVHNEEIVFDDKIKQIFKGGPNGVLSLGFQIPHKKNYFVTELRVQHSFKSITGDVPYKNLIWMLNVGYVFPITKEMN